MKFVAFERAKQGTGASRRLRNTGKTPGIVYGGEGQPQLIELDHNALWHALKKEAFHSTVLEMEFGGQTSKVLPEFIEVDLSGLKKGMSLHLNDIALPKGVKAVTRGKPNPVLVSVVATVAEEAPAPAEGAAAAPAADAKGGKPAAKAAKK
jgi:ribosomal protein L25 (general stress protein Ctc)